MIYMYTYIYINSQRVKIIIVLLMYLKIIPRFCFMDVSFFYLSEAINYRCILSLWFVFSFCLFPELSLIVSSSFSCGSQFWSLSLMLEAHLKPLVSISVHQYTKVRQRKTAWKLHMHV